MARKVICDRCGDDVTEDYLKDVGFLVLVQNKVGDFYTCTRDLCYPCMIQIARACEPQPRTAPSPPGVR